MVLLLILCGVFIWFLAKSYLGAVQQNRTRAIATQFGFAMRELGEAPPGSKRVETFVARLRAIDTRRTAPEVRRALQDYIVTLDAALAAKRRDENIARYDQSIAQAKQRLTDAVRENE